MTRRWNQRGRASRSVPACVSLLTSLFITAAASAGDWVDDFEGATNAGQWSFNVTTPDVLNPAGGNPGAWLQNPGVFSFAPILTSGPGAPSPVIGDLRAAGVTQISIDAQTLSCGLGCAGRSFALLLRDTKGTATVNDDDYAYFASFAPAYIAPQPGQGWLHFDFDVPAASTDPVPPGWSGGWVGDLESFRPGVEWSDVITSVDRVEFWWLHPAFVALIQDWNIGVDNITVTIEGGNLPGDLNEDGAVNLLDYNILSRCVVGPNVTPSPNCTSSDLDNDNDVDLADVHELWVLFGTAGDDATG